MEIKNKLTKITTLIGFILGLMIIWWYNLNNKVGNSGSLYLFIIMAIYVLYGFLIGFLYYLFRNRKWLNTKGIILYTLLLIIMTALLLFSTYVLFFALDFTSGY